MLSRHGREIGQERVEVVSRFEVVDQGPNGNAVPAKTAVPPRISGLEVISGAAVFISSSGPLVYRAGAVAAF
jgi:hypothetical protein